MPDAVTLGAVNADFIAKVKRFPGRDDEILVDSLTLHGGGSAANVAVGITRLGHRAGFVGVVGKDHFASMLTRQLEEEGVDISRIIRKEGNSGLVFAAVAPDGSRSLFTYVGVGSKFFPEDVPLDYIKNAKFLHLTSLAGERALDTLQLAAETASRAGVKVILDPGCILAEKGLPALKELLRHCWAFLPNGLEARMLTGKEGPDAARTLLDAGPEAVVVTQGGAGCTLATRNSTQHIPVPETKTKTLDTTGCGDAFASGFITALLENKPLPEAVKFGILTGRLSASLEGARSVPRREEVEKWAVKASPNYF